MTYDGTDADDDGVVEANVDNESVSTESIPNVYDYVVSDGAELANALGELVNGNDVSIKLGRATSYDLASHTTLPLDISGTGPTIHGVFPKVENEDVNPDQRFSPENGAVIDLGGNSFLTGNDIRGANIQSLFLTNGTYGFDFGETERLGCYKSRFENIYSHQLSKELFRLTNIQHVYGEHIKAIDSRRVLHIINDHTSHAGANVEFHDVYLHALDSNGDGTGSFPDGGIKLEAIQNNVNNTYLSRPQVNFVDGADGTGTNFRTVGSGSNVVTSLTVLGGNFEGAADKGFHGSRIVQSNIQMQGSQANSYSVLLDEGSNNTPSTRNVVINYESAVGAPCKSTDARNSLYGIVRGVEGSWTGKVHDISVPGTKGISRNLSPDPSWRAGQHTIIEEPFNSLDGYRQQDAGGGETIAAGWSRGLKLYTDTASGSYAQIRKDLYEGGIGNIDALGDVTQFAAQLNFYDTQGPLYGVAGRVTQANKTSAHVGFAMEGGDLIGTAADTSSQSKTTLISGATSGVYNCRAVVYPQSEIQYYVDGTLQGTDSGPTLFTGSPTVASFVAEYNGAQRKLECAEYRFVHRQ